MMKPVIRPRRRYALCVASIAAGGSLLLSGALSAAAVTRDQGLRAGQSVNCPIVNTLVARIDFCENLGQNSACQGGGVCALQWCLPFPCNPQAGWDDSGAGSRRVLLTNCNALATQQVFTCILDPVLGCVCNPQEPVWPPTYVDCGVNWPYYAPCSG